MTWIANGLVGNLPAAIEHFHSKLPGWWFSVGLCHVSADASCAPDSAGMDSHLLKDDDVDVRRYFDNGFDVDLPPPATMADALFYVTEVAWLARDTFFLRRNLNYVKIVLRERFGIDDD